MNMFDIMSSRKSKRHQKYNTFSIVQLECILASWIHPGPLPDPSRRASEKDTFSFYELLSKLRFWARSDPDLSGPSQNPSQNLSQNPSQNLSQTLPESLPELFPEPLPEPSQILYLSI